MPTEEEFKVALDDIANYVQKIDDEITTRGSFSIEYEDQNNEIHEFTGHRCLHKNTTYIIVGNDEFKYMSILSFMNVRQSIAQRISKEEAQEIIDENEEDEDIDGKKIAANELLQQADPEEMQAAISYIYAWLSGDNYLIEIQSTDTGAIAYMSMERKIFPYEDEFSIRELNNSITAVVSAGEKARNLVPRTITIAKQNNDPSEYELNFTPSW